MKEQKSILEFKIKNFRAIGEANIKLNGITVVAGENSSGKSTIARLLYYLFKISNHYDDIVRKESNDKIIRVTRLLKRLHIEFINEDIQFLKIHHLITLDEKLSDIKEEELIHIIDEIENGYLNLLKKIEDNKRIDRIQRLALSYFDDNEKVEIDKMFKILKDRVKIFYSESEKKIKERNKNLFEKKLANVYNQKLKNFSVYEYGIPIIKKDSEKLEPFVLIKNAIYIDSPMAVEHPEYTGYWRNRNLEIDSFSHWKDLDFYLKQKNKKQVEEIRDTKTYNELQTIFKSKEVLDGDIELNEGQEKLVFHRNDGKSFNVEDCATGIKSIAILQTLYKNGWLNRKTLLVLDEPEAHLHPQWIVEYARLVVLLNKKIGVKFLISSHNPDMVSAIQDICDKEKLNDNLKFYLAEKQEDYTYNFVDKGIDEEDIFECV